MANLKQKQSEIEKALGVAFHNYKTSLEAILGVKDLEIDVDVVGVKLSTLAIVVEEGEDIDLNVILNSGINYDKTRYYIELDSVSYEHQKHNG